MESCEGEWTGGSGGADALTSPRMQPVKIAPEGVFDAIVQPQRQTDGDAEPGLDQHHLGQTLITKYQGIHPGAAHAVATTQSLSVSYHCIHLP